MANNISIVKNGDVVFHKCLNALKKGSVGKVKRRMWMSDGVPAVDSGSQGTYPVAVGDLAYDYTNSNAYVNTVAPTASTNATFVKMVP